MINVSEEDFRLIWNALVAARFWVGVNEVLDPDLSEDDKKLIQEDFEFIERATEKMIEVKWKRD